MKTVNLSEVIDFVGDQQSKDKPKYGGSAQQVDNGHMDIYFKKKTKKMSSLQPPREAAGAVEESTRAQKPLTSPGSISLHVPSYCKEWPLYDQARVQAKRAINAIHM